MEIVKPTDEYVEDDFEEPGAHERLDEEIRQIFPHIVTSKNFDLLSPLLLGSIVKQSRSRLFEKYPDLGECEDTIKNKPRLRYKLLNGSKNGYKSVRLLSKDLSVFL